jgi:hypothetical protein
MSRTELYDGGYSEIVWAAVALDPLHNKYDKDVVIYDPISAKLGEIVIGGGFNPELHGDIIVTHVGNSVEVRTSPPEIQRGIN